MTGTSRALGEPYRKQPGDERRTGYFSLNTSPSCAPKAEPEEKDDNRESAGRLRRERRTLQRPGIRQFGLERIPAEAAAVRQQRSKVVTREQVHSRPFSERAGVFCAISPAGGRRASMNGHLRERWKQAVQKLIAQYREYDKKPKERKGK